MIDIASTTRVCSQGHKYVKSSDCPTCPLCESEKRPSIGLLAELGAPARRALERAGITTTIELAKYTEAQVMALHGVGPGSLPKLRQSLQSEGLSFKATTQFKAIGSSQM